MNARFFIQDSKLWDRLDLSEPVMCWNEAEEKSHIPLWENARGDCLVFGLGLGLILPRLKRTCTNITVVEKYQEIIDLGCEAREGVTIMQGDFFDFVPDRPYDTIWVDIWQAPSDNPRSIPERVEHYRRYLTPGGWIGYWRRS